MSKTYRPYEPKRYWNGLFSEGFDVSKVGYVELGRTWNTWSYRLRRWSFLRALSGFQLDLKNATVLEVGFGVGFYLDFWTKLLPKRLVGVDISHRAVEHARLRYPRFEFHLGDIAEMDLADEKFDLITAVDVLYHIVDDEAFRKAITRLCSLLKPGGVILFTDRLEENQIIDPRFPHVHCRSLKEYQCAVEGLGVSVFPLNVVMITMANPTMTFNHRLSAVVLKQVWRAISIPLRLFRDIPAAQNILGYFLGITFYFVDLFLIEVWSSAPNLRFAAIVRRNDRDWEGKI